MTDHQTFINAIQAQAGVYAFDKLPDETLSEIRLENINPIFDRIAHLNNMNLKEFKAGMPYGEFAFKDPNFEKICYNCGISHEPQYDYVNAQGFWISGMYLPLDSDNENTFYVGYIIKLSHEADSSAMTKNETDITSAVLETSIKLHRSNNFYISIKEIVNDISKLCDSRQCVVVTVDREEQKCELITEDGIDNDFLERISMGMNRTPYETIASWEKLLGQTDCLIFSNKEEMSMIKEKDPLWYDSLCDFNIRSIVLYALRFHEQIVGVLWCTDFNVEKIQTIKKVLGLISFFIGSSIANHQLMSRLRVMSMIDTLSGVYNRNAMNIRIDEFYKNCNMIPSSVGIVFADLNGLKRVNDYEGHGAGDYLIQQAAGILRTAFAGFDIYRSGGDEFMVICTEITPVRLDECISKLRKLSAETGRVHFAIGASYKCGRYDLKAAMQEADEKMYKDKEDYYKAHPELKRR